jgi:hypothetical protein
MSLRQLPKTDVIAALRSAPAGRLNWCIEALAREPRDAFTTTEAPAVLLRENLEPKHRIARARGKIIRGDDDLLVALADLGSELVSGVFFDDERKHIALYLRATTLEPVGCVTVEDPEDA